MEGRLGYTSDLSKTKKQQILCKGKTSSTGVTSTLFRNLETEVKTDIDLKKAFLEMEKWWNG